MPIDRDALAAWHRQLLEDRGQRAELRRVRDPLDAALIPAFHRLAVAQPPDVDRARLAYIATVLADVDRNSTAPSFGATCSGHVSEMRMRRLLETQGGDRAGLCTQIRTALRLTGKAAPLSDLADGIYFWGNQVRRRWATDYYTRGKVDE